jgi:hypothetical protein
MNPHSSSMTRRNFVRATAAGFIALSTGRLRENSQAAAPVEPPPTGAITLGSAAPGAPTDTTAIRHTREYLERFQGLVATSPDGAALEAALIAAYPDAGLAIAAGLGSKVAKGEMTWG